MGDHLDSTRLAMSGSAASERHDYLPFGQEYSAAAGNWRLGGGIQGYGTDTVRQKFTGQERDNETSLDFFQARYYSGAQGRFMSVDPGNAGADPSDPQSWNGYAYVSNNPLTYTDPDGLGIFGDIGSIVGSVFPGVGTLLGWGIGSIADLATGQSVSPPGFDIGGAIVGSIAGGVNNGPWSGAPGLGSGGGLNTGTVFGSGGTGPFINNILQTAGGNGWDLIFYAQAIGYLQRDPTMARIIRQLQRSRQVYTVSFIRNGNDSYLNGRVEWDPTSSLLTTGGGCQSAALGLGHELAHAYEENRYPNWFARELGVPSPAYGNQVERWAITGPETSAAHNLGEPTRLDHAGRARHEVDATSRNCRRP
jgi:RHS repeat-associated protein